MIFTTAVWHLWRARNNAVFNLVTLHPSHTFNRFYVDFTSANNCVQAIRKDKATSAHSSQTWKPPSQGRYKLNTDASWKDRKSAGGGVVRRDDGSWVAGFAIKLRASDPQEAELMALRFGMLLMNSLDINLFDVEIDAAGIKNLLHGNEDLSGHKLAPIFQDVADILQSNGNIELMHTSRRNNKIAHALADMGMRMRRRKMFYDLPPPCVTEDYENDLKGI